MFIKSVVIDGFKSYGQRTEIRGFDPEFNAITGLNGSGKSNILDAICFLLGITNLSHVRATNLQELVYKNGQAGVTKATVTVTFDNSDKSQSPLGYESYPEVAITRQVVIGGKNKYLINGTNIQNNRVHDLFRSVQLNVNNPHFLIMQGRITKVLNMKPPEIVAMIEEAAGTMMYEAKKRQAQKTIEKKDSKLREINDLLDEEITPTLTKLKEERSTYLEFQKVQRELEHNTKIVIAFQFVSAEKASVELVEQLDTVKTELSDVQEAIREGENRVKEIQERLGELQRQRDEELGGSLGQAEKEHSEKEKEVVKSEAALKAVKDNKRQEEKKKKQIEKGRNSDQKHYDDKVKVADSLQDMYDKLRRENAEAEAALKAAQERFEAISVGKFASSEGGKAETLHQQLINAKKDITDAKTKIQTATLKINDNEKKLQQLEASMKKAESAIRSDKANLAKYEDQVAKAERELASINYEDGKAEELEANRDGLKQDISAQERQVGGMSAKFPWLEFHYRDPVRNFDRSQVRGTVANLFRVRDKKFFVALDTAFGSKVRKIILKWYLPISWAFD